MRKFSVTFEDHFLKVFYISNTEWAIKAINRLARSKATILGLDIETARSHRFEFDYEFGGLSPYCSKIRLIQIYDSSVNTCYMFDMFALGVTCKDAFKELFANRRFVAQWAVFDMHHLKHKGMPVKSCDCTLILANAVYRAETTADEIRSGLEALVEREFKVKIPKQLQASDWGREKLTDDQLKYAALDAYFVSRLAETYLHRVRKYKMQRSYALDRRLQHVVVDMQLRGIKTDRKKHAAMIYKWEQERFKAEVELAELMKGVNLNSPKQLTEWLRANVSEDDLKRWPLSETGRYLSTEADTFHAFDHLEIVEPISRYKKVEKMCSTYGRSLYNKQNPVTGRTHGNFTIGITRTGRLSGRNPNLTNQPRKEKNFKEIFVAKEGYKFLCADYSQIELRVMAHVTQDPVMLKAYKNGKDLHSVMAAVITRKKLGEVTKEDRQLAKSVNFGLCFGAGAATLQEYAKNEFDLKISLEQAQEYVELFHQLYAGYAKWKRRHSQQCEKTLFVRTQLGKLRKLHKNYYFTTGLNTPIQGGAAEIIKQAAVDVRESYIREALDAYILLLVHDELVSEVKDEPQIIACATEIMNADMTRAAEKVFPGIITRGIVETYSGYTWSEAKH